tara:strand:- start:20 stop:739 length:720 start_codon:yes stop_codon:yes gene_type:complete
MSDIFFITGTDTGVGKTVAASWLAFAASKKRKTALIKPMQTGTIAPKLEGDEAFYRKALPETVTVSTFSSLDEPLAPFIAAYRSFQTLDLEFLVEQSLAISTTHDISFFEGAGGFLVPITESQNMADYARQLEARIILVARPDLGTLNHTILTIEAIEQRNLKLDFLVISGFPVQADVVHWENIRFLGSYFPNLPILILGWIDVSAPSAIQEMDVKFYNRKPSFLQDLAISPFTIPENI